MKHRRIQEGTSGMSVQLRERDPVRENDDVLDTAMSEATLALQHVHYDIVLPHPNLAALATIDPLDMAAAERAELKDQLEVIVTDKLLPLFPLRHKK